MRRTLRMCVLMAACLGFGSGCAGLQKRGPQTLDSVIRAAEASIPIVSIATAIACAQEPDPMACNKIVADGETAALAALAVIKKWAPTIKEAMRDGDTIKNRKALEHIQEAMKHVPEAYNDILDLVERLSEVG